MNPFASAPSNDTSVAQHPTAEHNAVDIPTSWPRLKGTVEVLDASDGTLYLIPAVGASDFLLPAVSAADRALLKALDGTQPASAIAEYHSQAFPKIPVHEVLSGITALADAGLLEDAQPRTVALATHDKRRQDRQLAYFADLIAYGDSAEDRQQRLASATVAILGLGGVGSWVAFALAGMGVGHLILVDGDTVDLSNLNRQILYIEADLGNSKAAAAECRLSAFNSALSVTTVPRFLDTPEAVHDAIEGSDFVIEAADSPVHSFARWVDAACRDLNIPHISMSQVPPLVRVGPTFVPGQTGCQNCYEQPAREDFPLYDELVDYRRNRGAVASATAPGCALIGSLVAFDVLHYLTGLAVPATLGTAFTLDTRTLALTRESVHRYPNCQYCSQD